MQTRNLEFGLAIIMGAAGLQLAWPGQTFSPPYAAVMTRYLDETSGGWLLVAISIVRMAVLIINGNLRTTPLVRIACCCIGSGFWIAFMLTVAGVDRGPGYGLPLIASMAAAFVVLESYAGLKCGSDASVLDSLFIRQRRSRVSRGR